MTNEDIIKGLTLMRKNFDSNSVYGSYCIDCLDAAIEALKEQQEHSQNTSSKQPDLDTLGIKTGETCADAISRRDAIDAVEFGITYVKVLNKETGEVMELFKKSNEELQKAVETHPAITGNSSIIPITSGTRETEVQLQEKQLSKLIEDEKGKDSGQGRA